MYNSSCLSPSQSYVGRIRIWSCREEEEEEEEELVHESIGLGMQEVVYVESDAA